jgi:hypothetical protein
MSDYPKRLYLGPYRTAVTVETAEEEAMQRALYPETATPAAEPPAPTPPVAKQKPVAATTPPKKGTRR